MQRRTFFLGLMLLPLAARAQSRELVFPRDHGAHPAYPLERWALTGWLDAAGGPVGFQIAFSRVRGALLAHAAIADPGRGRLLHDERVAQPGASLAEAETQRTGVWIDDWTLTQERLSYEARIPARGFTLELGLYARELRAGEAGYSRPQIPVTGALDGRAVTGTAWLEHEWSSIDKPAGQAWCGINLANGKSVRAAGGSLRPLRTWQSPRTRAVYPVEAQLGDLVLKPLMDDQELDLRASTRSISWSGAVSALRGGTPVGRGYLELSGY